MATFGVVWVIVMRPWVSPMMALPALTTPPTGVASAKPPQASIKAIASGCQGPMPAALCWAMTSRGSALTTDDEDGDGPCADACSDVATQVPVLEHQMER